MFDEITLVQKTPIWMAGHGGPDGIGGLYGSGFLGGLRWWAAALLRGLGHPIDHGTNDGSCQVNDPEHNACKLCQVFGCTSWQRRFRLDVPASTSVSNTVRIGRKNHGGPGPHRGWNVVPDFGLDPALRFVSLFRPGGMRWEPLMGAVLTLIERRAAIGGKTATGHGVMGLSDDDAERIAAWLGELPPAAVPAAPAHSSLPDMRHFVYSEYTIPGALDPHRLPLRGMGGDQVPWLISAPDGRQAAPASPLVRSELRTWIRTQGWPDPVRHWLMGAVQGSTGGWEPIGSKILVSHLFRPSSHTDWRMRIWAWLPPRACHRGAGDGGNANLSAQSSALRALLCDEDQVRTIIGDALEFAAGDAITRVTHWQHEADGNTAVNLHSLLELT